jgi:hypothetical protein
MPPPTIDDEAVEYHNPRLTKQTKKKDQTNVTVLAPNIIPSRTRHYKQIEGAATPDAKYRSRKLNLKSEKQFIEEYQAKGIEVYADLEDPTDDKEKGILHDNFRREGAVRTATILKAQFTLGERTKIVLDTPRVFATQDREDAELEKLNTMPEYLDLLEEMMNIDENVGLYDMLKKFLVSKENFGNGILVKQYDADGIPIRLIPLWSVRLGKRYVNAETHELLGIEYKDYEGEERILRIEDLIYDTADDFPITPNSRHFGLPPNEVALATALNNRITMETADAEVVTRHWAPMRVIKAPGITGQTKLTDFSTKILPGKDLVTNQNNISVETIDLKVSSQDLLDSVQERQKKIFRDLKVPLVIGFQDEQNRATAYAALHQWTESVIKDQRTSLKNTLEEQWYKPCLSALIRRAQKIQAQTPTAPVVQTPPNIQDIRQRLQAPPLTSPPLDEEIQPVPNTPVGAALPHLDQIDPNDPPFRFKMSFEDIIFDTFLEKAAAVLGYKEARIIDEEIAMEVGGFSDEHIERMRAKWAEKAAMTVQPTAVSTQPMTEGNGQEEQIKPGVPALPIAARSGGSKVNDGSKYKNLNKLRNIEKV